MPRGVYQRKSKQNDLITPRVMTQARQALVSVGIHGHSRVMTGATTAINASMVVQAAMAVSLAVQSAIIFALAVTTSLGIATSRSALRYTQMASANPQIWVYSNAGDQHSIVLNKLRERAMAAIFGSNDDIGWFEWSAPQGIKFDNSPAFWLGVCQANPSLGITVHPDNIRAVLTSRTISSLVSLWIAIASGLA